MPERPLTVLVDAREAVKVATGVGTLARGLARELERSSDARLRFVVLPRTYDDGPEPPRRKPKIERAWNLLKNVFWKQVSIPFAALLRRADAIFVLDPIVPVWGPCPIDVYIHDLQSFDPRNPAMDPPWRVYITVMTKAARRVCRHFFANSDATRRDIVRVLGVPESRTHRVYPGLKPEFRPVTDPEKLAETRKRHGLVGPFILVVGTTDPKRNFPRILEAFLRLREDPARREQLVCVGPKTDFFSGEVVANLRRHGLGEEVRFIGYVPLDDLPALYSLAEVYLYPSLFEGFGFTPAEAMACGCPVITSNVSSLPEVVGEAGLKVNPESVEEIRAALEDVLASPGRRAELREKGLARAQVFRWDLAAEAVRKVYLGEA